MEDKIQQLWDRQDKLEERVRLVENQQAGTIIYIKEIKEDLREIKEDIKKIKPSDINRQEKFWDTETKKAAIKWAGIVILVVLALIAGRGIYELVDVIPR